MCGNGGGGGGRGIMTPIIEDSYILGWHSINDPRHRPVLGNYHRTKCRDDKKLLD